MAAETANALIGALSKVARYAVALGIGSSALQTSLYTGASCVVCVVWRPSSSVARPPPFRVCGCACKSVATWRRSTVSASLGAIPLFCARARDAPKEEEERHPRRRRRRRRRRRDCASPLAAARLSPPPSALSLARAPHALCNAPSTFLPTQTKPNQTKTNRNKTKPKNKTSSRRRRARRRVRPLPRRAAGRHRRGHALPHPVGADDARDGHPHAPAVDQLGDRDQG
jgi:hypothetical protein